MLWKGSAWVSHRGGHQHALWTERQAHAAVFLVALTGKLGCSAHVERRSDEDPVVGVEARCAPGCPLRLT